MRKIITTILLIVAVAFVTFLFTISWTMRNVEISINGNEVYMDILENRFVHTLD